MPTRLSYVFHRIHYTNELLDFARKPYYLRVSREIEYSNFEKNIFSIDKTQ